MGKKLWMVLIFTIGLALPTLAAGPGDWRMLETDHFYLYYPVGKEAALHRIAPLAEDIHQRLTEVFPKKNPYKTHVVLRDETDLSNGLASPFPYPRIFLDLATPVDDLALGLGEMEWLELVFTHEYAHILQLGAGDGVAESLRRIFGSIILPSAFPPPWAHEGWAVYAESNYGPASGGRLKDASFRREPGVDWAELNLKRLDQVSNPMLTWPGNRAWYTYGALFHEYLAIEYGEDKLVTFYQRLAGNPPFLRFEGVFREVFGLSLSEAYQAWQRQLPVQAGIASSPPGRQLSTTGAVAAFPYWDEEGNLYYVEDNYSRPDRLMKGKEGRFTAVTGWDGKAGYLILPGGDLIYAQLRWEGELLSYDLYRTNERGQKEQRLTKGERATQPTAAPDGRRIAFTAHDPPFRHIKGLDLQTGELTFLLKGNEEESFSAPAWSPDGRTLAVVVERRGFGRRIELLDLTTKERQPLTGRWWAEAEPAWDPNGHYLLFTAEENGHRNLYAFNRQTAEIRLLIRDGGPGVVSPDGQSLVFLGYTSGGFHLFQTAFYPWAGDTVPLPAERSTPAAAVQPPLPPVEVKASSYRFLPSLKPHFWIPLPFANDEQGFGLGVYTAGQDILGFFRYNLFCGVNTSGDLSYDLAAIYTVGRSDLTLTVNPGIGYGVEASRYWRSLLVANDALLLGAGWTKADGWSTGLTYTTARTYGLNPEPSTGLGIGLSLAQFGAGQALEATVAHYPPLGDGRVKGEMQGVVTRGQEARFDLAGYAHQPAGTWLVRTSLGVKGPLVRFERGYLTPPVYLLDCWGGLRAIITKAEGSAAWWPVLEAELNFRTVLGFVETPYNLVFTVAEGLADGRREFSFTAGLPL